jgi:hypothetical protein
MISKVFKYLKLLKNSDSQPVVKQWFSTYGKTVILTCGKNSDFQPVVLEKSLAYKI